jgi:hypothetical protein
MPSACSRRLRALPGWTERSWHVGAHPSSIDAQYLLLDQLYPEGYRYLTDNLWVRPTEAGLARDAKPIFEPLLTDHSHIVLAPWLPQTHPNAAFGPQTEMSFHVYAVSDDPDQDPELLAWHADALARVEPYPAQAGRSTTRTLFVRRWPLRPVRLRGSRSCAGCTTPNVASTATPAPSRTPDSTHRRRTMSNPKGPLGRQRPT